MSKIYETCSACSGSGMYWAGEDVKPCSECKGNTVVPVTHPTQPAGVRLSKPQELLLHDVVQNRPRGLKLIGPEFVVARPLEAKGLITTNEWRDRALPTDAGIARSLLAQTEGAR